MLFVIDVGNTNTVLGIYRDTELVCNWRIRTEKSITEDEFNLIVTQLFHQASLETDQISKTIISCVVPPMVGILDAFCRRYLNAPPKWVDARSTTQMPIRIHNPAEVGADRIVNAVAAYHKYKHSLVVIDFGTATTFDAISAAGEYLGGAISPGIGIASEALFQKASKLPRVEIFQAPDNVIGKDTISSIQSGIIYGYAGLVDGITRRMAKELIPAPRVIATGGLAPLISEVAEVIDQVEPDLTLEGLRLLGQ